VDWWHNQKANEAPTRVVSVLLKTLHRSVTAASFALSSLMPCARQQLAVLVLTHLFSSFFDHAAQPITPIHRNIMCANLI
jgi:hypothetical protein